MTDAITKLLLETKATIQSENVELARRIEANNKLLDQLEARLNMSPVHDLREAKCNTFSRSNTRSKKTAGAALAFSDDSHTTKLMRVIYNNRAGVTSDELQAQSGIDPASVKNIKKTVWNTTWRLCNDGYAERVGEKKDKIIPTERGIRVWEASPMHLAA